MFKRQRGLGVGAERRLALRAERHGRQFQRHVMALDAGADHSRAATGVRLSKRRSSRCRSEIGVSFSKLWTRSVYAEYGAVPAAACPASFQTFG